PKCTGPPQAPPYQPRIVDRLFGSFSFLTLRDLLRRQPCIAIGDDDPSVRKDLMASATGPGNSSWTESLPEGRITRRTFGREARASISAFALAGAPAPCGSARGPASRS